MRAGSAEAAERKVRKKYPKARHIEIMEAIPTYDGSFPPWEYWRPYVAVCFCLLMGLITLGVVIAWKGTGEPFATPEENEIQQQQQQQQGPLAQPKELDEYPTAETYEMLLDDR